MTAKETIAKVEKEREELRGYFGKEMDARVAAQDEARRLKAQLDIVEAQRVDAEARLAELHNHIKVVCVRLGVDPEKEPADSWTLLKSADAAHKREESALNRAHTNASILDEIAKLVKRADGVSVLDAVHSFVVNADLDVKKFKRKLIIAHTVGIRMTAERDLARRENARLHRECEAEHEHVQLLTAENDRLSGSLDSALDQLIERGHEIARLRGAVAAQHAGTKFARFVGRIAQIVGLS